MNLRLPGSLMLSCNAQRHNEQAFIKARLWTTTDLIHPGTQPTFVNQLILDRDLLKWFMDS
jgi:hypothetical protein